MLPSKPTFLTKLSLPLLRNITALSLHQTPPPAKHASLSLLADKCKTMDQLKQIHAQMITTARIRDNFASGRLINFCALSPSGSLNHAIKLFRRTPLPNLFMWNTVIRAHASSSSPFDGLLLYTEMRRRGVRPGKHTFPFVLKACSNVKSAKSCQQVHGHVLKFGLVFDLHIANGLVRCYSVTGGLSSARKVFDELSERNLSIWTTMICGYAQNNSAVEAISLFHGMIADGLEPKEVVLCSVLSACAQSACLNLGEQIHAL